MKKIPTLFERDWDNPRRPVIDAIKPECAWVAAGEGAATRKYDGTCCLIREGRLYKRRELKDGDNAPECFEPVDHDDETGKTVGWLPVGDGPEDRWHREAFARFQDGDLPLLDGTCELLGPKIQGNPERFDFHQLLMHEAAMKLPDAPRTFEALRDYFSTHDIEGIVWHHPDGRMAKIKGKDFGLKRK